MTVREYTNNHLHDNNGIIRVYNNKTKMFVNNQDFLESEVLEVKTHPGYGYKQVNTTLHIYK